jgi:hypothetical protein
MPTRANFQVAQSSRVDSQIMHMGNEDRPVLDFASHVAIKMPQFTNSPLQAIVYPRSAWKDAERFLCDAFYTPVHLTTRLLYRWFALRKGEETMETNPNCQAALVGQQPVDDPNIHPRRIREARCSMEDRHWNGSQLS